VWGYTVIDDVTARDLQRDHKQWLLGKGLDTHCPMGPYAVTADEISDVGSLEVQTLVNGKRLQHAPVKDLIFDIPTLIVVISAGITLLPGNPILIPNRPWATRIPQPPIPTRTQHPTAPRLPSVRQPRPSQ